MLSRPAHTPGLTHPSGVILVEDNPSDVAIIRRYFEDAHPDTVVETAGSIAEARALLVRFVPEIMICDYRLPDGECTELLASLQTDQKFATIVMTAHGDERIAVEAIKSGALDYVVKSAESFAALPRICERVIREWHHIQESRGLGVQLQESQRRNTMGQLAGAIAHDFNNILTPILLSSHMLVSDLEDSGEACERARRIQEAAQRAKELVERLLAFGRHAIPEVKSVRLHDLVVETLKLVRVTLPATFEIHEKLDAPEAFVFGDETQLHQVLMNLCTNAYQAMGESGGRLEVGMQEMVLDGGLDGARLELAGGSYLRIRVSDDGPGMSPETLERIFEAFYTTKPLGQGTGLGLSVVKAIITEHSGAITVRSTPGEGATFEVYLPVTLEREAAPPAENAIERGVECLLLIDDEPDVGSVTSELLQSYGYEVAVFDSAGDGLDAWLRSPDAFDLVITDQVMPGTSGDELAALIKSVRPDVPVLVTTGYSDKVNQDNFQDHGFDFILMKPVNPRELASTVRHLLDSRPAPTIAPRA
ncbi:MAG: response regulator [Verrucomicrobia bacterium]|nr:response regulator [Verrucomicrobiota bacterium]MDA1085864.1 response regulator [Verrucomicrobiota bacterium]